MSVESMAIALNHSQAGGTAKLVLMGIANHDGDGGAWPSVDTLAKYANVHRRNAQRAIERLEALGEIQVIRNGGGSHSVADSHRPNLYRVTLKCPPDCDRSSQHRTRKTATPLFVVPVDNYPIVGVAVAPPGGGNDAGGVAVAPHEPSSKPNNYRKSMNHSTRECTGGHPEIADTRYCIYGDPVREMATS
jgi:hypothetical protein